MLSMNITFYQWHKSEGKLTTVYKMKFIWMKDYNLCLRRNIIEIMAKLFSCDFFLQILWKIFSTSSKVCIGVSKFMKESWVSRIVLYIKTKMNERKIHDPKRISLNNRRSPSFFLNLMQFQIFLYLGVSTLKISKP